MNQTNPYIPQTATILSTKALTPTERLIRLALDSGNDLGHISGQFIEVSIFGYGEAPLTIASPPGEDWFEICVRAAGNVTKKLHQMQVGDKVGIRGPMGRGFPLDKMEGKDLIYVAGGIGMVPLRPLIQQTVRDRDKYGKITVLYGTKEPSERVFMDDLKEWDKRPDIDYRHTLDRAKEGWTGHVGVVTTFIPELDINPKNTVAVVVGPPLMYKFVIMGLADRGVSDENILLSFERNMKCGIGKCGHCQMNNVLVCRKGPTFTTAEIRGVWEAL